MHTTILTSTERCWFLYGHVIGPDAITIFLVDIEPLLGALGSAGAIATTQGAAPLHWTVKGWVVRVYCVGGGAKDQLTGSGLTVVGELEKLPVATNSICWLFAV